MPLHSQGNVYLRHPRRSANLLDCFEKVRSDMYSVNSTLELRSRVSIWI